LQNSKFNGDLLFVIVNNDFQRLLKGSKEFQNEEERLLIVENLKMVNKSFLSIDKDRTIIETIKHIYNNFKSEFDFVFANGGDQNNKNIPERAICEELGIQFIDGLGDKIQSLSWLLKNV